MQSADAFRPLLRAVLDRRDQLLAPGQQLPVAVKIAPDLNAEEVGELALALEQGGADAVIATNTTIARPPGIPEITGGLSGRPLAAAALEVVGALAERLQGRLPIIGVGGVDSPEGARRLLDAGASLVQFYTGLIYQGPELVRRLVRGTKARR